MNRFESGSGPRWLGPRWLRRWLAVACALGWILGFASIQPCEAAAQTLTIAETETLVRTVYFEGLPEDEARLIPWDEARATVALDLSGRPVFRFKGDFDRERVGELAVEMVPHFFRSLSTALGASLQIDVQGENTHHKIEAAFEGVGRAFRAAAARTSAAELPTTKGAL